MSLFEKLIYSPGAAAGLCGTCRWGTIRAGFSETKVEAFCRLIHPAKRLRFAVRDCTNYCDRRVTAGGEGERRFGFVTEIKLESGEIGCRGRNQEKPTEP